MGRSIRFSPQVETRGSQNPDPEGPGSEKPRLSEPEHGRARRPFPTTVGGGGMASPWPDASFSCHGRYFSRAIIHADFGWIRARALGDGGEPGGWHWCTAQVMHRHPVLDHQLWWEYLGRGLEGPSADVPLAGIVEHVFSYCQVAIWNRRERASPGPRRGRCARSGAGWGGGRGARRGAGVLFSGKMQAAADARLGTELGVLRVALMRVLLEIEDPGKLAVAISRVADASARMVRRMRRGGRVGGRGRYWIKDDRLRVSCDQTGASERDRSQLTTVLAGFGVETAESAIVVSL